MSKILNTSKSRECFERSKNLIPGGVASNLHKSDFEEYPIFIESGKGSKIYDVDGNEYIDYMGAFGPMILGYSPEAVSQEVVEQIGRGSQFAAPTESLNDVSERIIEKIPCADMVSYQSTGTEANMAAFRLARAYTGKDKIVKFEGHYHGWSDEEMISVASNSLKLMGPRNKPWKILGSPGQTENATENILVLPWNDLDLVREIIKRHGHEIAAIIMEPIMLNCEPVFPQPGYLEGVRQLTAEIGIVLIFDEVITGFRLSLGGAQEYFNVIPDLCTFGKAVAGGFQLAGIAGRKQIMASGVHPSGTFNANPIVIGACKATISELERPGIYEHMAKLTRRLTEGIASLAKRKHLTLYCYCLGSIWQLAFGVTEGMRDYRDTFKVDRTRYQRLRIGCLERGVRLHPSRGRLYTSAAHTDDDVEKTLEVMDDVLAETVK